MKKDQGNLMGLFPPILTIMALAVMLIFFSGWMANISARDNVYQLSRRYILQMEGEGCLNSSLESRLRSDLATAGMSNISLAGTTTLEVDYGNVIGYNKKRAACRAEGTIRLMSVAGTGSCNRQLPEL